MNEFWIIIFFIFIAFAIWARLQVPKWKGMMGESFIRGKLKKLNPTYYRILNDIMIPSAGNTTATQIDHIVVSNFGIFCIETKAHKGWIFGNANSEYWTQAIYRFKDKFYNPLRQGYAHTEAVKKLFANLPSTVPVMTLVAFPNAARLQISGTDLVGTGAYILDKILSFQKNVLSDLNRDKVYEIIKSTNITDKDLRRKHNSEIKALRYHRG